MTTVSESIDDGPTAGQTDVGQIDVQQSEGEQPDVRQPEVLRDPTGGPPERDAPTSRSGRSWRGRLLVLLIVAALVALAVRQIGIRAENADRSSLDQVTLTADPVAVVADTAGVVDELAVRPGQTVERGQLLLTVQPGAWVPGGPLPPEQRIEAPAAGTVSDLDLRPGSSLRVGDAAVRLYQASQLHFRATVPSDELPDLEVGMTGELRAGRIGPLAVRLTRIEPQLNGDPTEDGTSILVLTPIRIDDVENLVPGLRFEGWLDRDSLPSGS